MAGFIKGSVYQRQLGIRVFDPALLNQIGIEHKTTGTVRYLHSRSDAAGVCDILVFEDRCLVYIFWAKSRGD